MLQWLRKAIFPVTCFLLMIVGVPMIFDQALQALSSSRQHSAATPAAGAAARMELDIPEGSPAHEAGLRDGDIIRFVNGTSVSTPEQLNKALATLREGEEIRLGISRDGTQTTVIIKQPSTANS